MVNVQPPSDKYQGLIWAKMIAHMILLFVILLLIVDILITMFNKANMCLIHEICKCCANHPICGVVIIAVLCGCVYLTMFNRNFYLPFLGYSAFPCGSMVEKVPADANTEVKVVVPPNVNVIYWASENPNKLAEPISNPWDAYGNYDNAGVVKSDDSGVAILKVRMPVSYKVGLMHKTLNKHVHYRYCELAGMLSEVKTIIL
jgi:hypothetical protein